MAALELSRRVLVERIGQPGSSFSVEATPAERDAIAARLMIPDIIALRCQWDLRPGEAGTVRGLGTLQAKVVQTCGITLDAFPTEVAESFEVHFVVAGRESEEDDPDEPDQLVYDGVAIDVGEATVEQLALALDPYPRKPAVALPAAASTGPASPFAALARLRDLD